MLPHFKAAYKIKPTVARNLQNLLSVLAVEIINVQHPQSHTTPGPPARFHLSPTQATLHTKYHAISFAHMLTSPDVKVLCLWES